jgi:hypothetical protein
MAKGSKKQFDDLSPKAFPVVGLDAPAGEEEQLIPSENTIGDPRPQTVDGWIKLNEQWIRTEARGLYQVVRRFVSDFDLLPIMECDLQRFEPSLQVRRILEKLLINHRKA